MTIQSLSRWAGIDAIPEWVWNFQHTPDTRVHFGLGVVAEAGRHAREMGSRHVLVVTDPGLARGGHLRTVLTSLQEAGVEFSVFEDVVPNPTLDTVEHCLSLSQAFGVDGFVALGGGSSLDTAKATNFLYTNGGPLSAYCDPEAGRVKEALLPWLAIPTTAGTGSECLAFAFIHDPAGGRVLACGDRQAAARQVLLDPQLTLTQPRRVAVLAALGALALALESAVCPSRTEVSVASATAAFRLLAAGLPRVLADPQSLEARGLVQVGAALAGAAEAPALPGAAHAAATLLTARFGLAHGLALALMMPHVLRHNLSAPAAAETYRTLLPGEDPAAWFSGLVRSAGVPMTLEEGGVPLAERGSLPALAAAAAGVEHGNPAPVDEAAFAAWYRAVWG